MKKFFFLAALLCASVMAFAVAPVVGSSTENMDGQPGFTNGYDYSFSTEGTSVTISFTEKENYTGLVAYLWNYTNGFAETGMTVEGHTASITLTNQVAGSSLTFACKFAFAGGMSVTKQFTYVVPNDGGGEEPAAEPTEIYDTNFALASNGSTATASSGTAASAIDGNTGTRWESASSDPQTWTLDMGQLRIYNTIQIVWEGAYGKTFDIESSKDGENWKVVKQVADQELAGFPYEQTLELAANDTAQYIRFTGKARGTGYGYSFWEFRVLLPGTSVLTSIGLTAAGTISKIGGAGVALTVSPKDQNGAAMDVEISYEVTPADAGAVVEGKYVAAKTGAATIIAKNGEVKSAAVTIYGAPSDNLALSTNIGTDNKVIAESEVTGNATSAFYAVDGNKGSVWQACRDLEANKTSVDFTSFFTLDLGGLYDISLIAIWFDGAASDQYTIEFSANNADWVEGFSITQSVGNYTHQKYLMESDLTNRTKVRYVRFTTTKASTQNGWGMKIFEYEVYGSEWIDSGDTEAPEMVSASLVSKTWNSAVIAVAATDNHEVASFHVVDASKEIDKTLVPADGKITVTGLTAETAYNFTITAIDAAQNESENNKSVAVTTNAHLLVPNVAAPAPTCPAAQVKSLYSDAYDFAPASLNSYNEGWWLNPNMTEETVGEDHYLHYDLYRNGMIGVQFAEVSVATMEKIHIDIFASAAGTVTFRPITVDGPNTPKTLILQAEQWNSFDIDTSEFKGHNWARLYQYAIEGYQAGGLVGEHISVDNVYFYRTTPLADTEAPTDVTASKSKESYYSVTLTAKATDYSGAVIFVVKNGENEVATAGGASGTNVSIIVSGLTPNTAYNFSVIAKDEAGNAAEPVAVAVKTLVAPAPADAPTYAADKVIAIYSDIYTDLPYNIQDWYAGPVIAEGALTISSNALCIEPNTTASSCFGIAFAATDITAYDALEMDVYATTANSALDIQVIGIGEAATTYNLVADQWNHILLNINGNTKTNCEQIGFYNCNNLKGTCFVQNVLFVKKVATAIDNTMEATKVQKMIENGQLIIIKNGIRYNVAGQMVK